MADECIGPYRILRELGSGGMGRVHLAEVVGQVPGLEPGTRVALKVIHPHLLETPGFFKRFLREAEIGRAVHHENVVQCHDCDALLVDGKHVHFLVMEYVEGQTLRDLANDVGCVPEQLCRHIGREVARGLHAIHEAGVLHRDLKPENVLLSRDHVVKIMDLGVARLQDEVVRLSQTGAFVGSLEYAAPEQFRAGGSRTDGRSDLHALGIVLYELSTGRHPFRADDASVVMRRILEDAPPKVGTLNPQLSPFFEEVVDRLLQKDPAMRIASAGELADVLALGEQSSWWRETVTALRAATQRPLRRIRIPRETALYGREDDLAALRFVCERASAGDGRVLLIEGEAGIGKTRLVDEFVATLRREGQDLNFLFGSYPPGGAATAAGAFSTAYRQQFGVESLEETLRGYLPETPILVPAFAALLRGESVPTGEEPLTKESLQSVFIHATRTLASERTTVVLIDDLHFAPEEGLALFASLALAVPGHRILLIGTARRGLPETWISGVTRLEHGRHQILHRLGAKDLAQLLEDAFQSPRLAEELSHRIALKSDGNPFFAFEIIRGLREGRLIEQDKDGTWVRTKVIEDIQVPSSVIDLVRARLSALAEEERNLLDVASCCGFEFDPLVVAAALGQAQIPAMQRFARIENRHGLVRSVGRHYVFDHHQVQEALYEGLPVLLKEPYHASLADALLASRGGATDATRDGALCVDLCEHYFEAGRGEKARPYLDAALQHLQDGYLNDQVVGLADRALRVEGLLEGVERVRILLRKAGRLHLMGRRAEQRDLLEEAEAAARDLDDEALLGRIDRARNRMLSAQGRYAEACEGFRRDAEQAAKLGDREQEIFSTESLGLVLTRLGRLDEARGTLVRALALARQAGHRAGEAGALRLLGDLAKDLGRFEESLGYHRSALALVRETGDLADEANCVGSLGNLFQVMGRAEEAREHYLRWQSMARAIGDRQSEAAAIGNLGIVLLGECRFEEARQQFERHRDLAREYGDQQGELNATANLALVADADGRLAASRTWSERALALAQAVGARDSEKVIRGNLGGTLTALGRLDEAEDHLQRSAHLARELGDQRAEAHALFGLAVLAGTREDHDEALHDTKRALALCRKVADDRRTAAVLVALARLHADREELREARALLDEALALATAVDATETIVRARVAGALLPGGDVLAAAEAVDRHADRLEAAARMEARFRLWQAAGRDEDLEAARRLLEGILEALGDEDRQAVRANVPLVREILAAR